MGVSALETAAEALELRKEQDRAVGAPDSV